MKLLYKLKQKNIAVVYKSFVLTLDSILSYTRNRSNHTFTSTNSNSAPDLLKP